MLFDDLYDRRQSTENTAWIYDVDFEFLNSENIKQIIIGGPRANDYYLRLLLAGIPAEKIKYTYDENNAGDLLELDGIKNIYILFDLYNAEFKAITENKVKEKMKNAN